MTPFSTASRREVRLTLTSPSSTHGVPPMRSSVENMKPWSLSSIRAVVDNTQSSFAFETCPISRLEPLPAHTSAISAKSASVRAVQSFVSTWSAIVSTAPELPCQVVFTDRRLRGMPAGQTGATGPFCHPRAVFRNRASLWCWSEDHGVVPEGHPELPDHAGEIDTIVVGKAYTVGAQIEHDW
jgi:hypothetical protein